MPHLLCRVTAIRQLAPYTLRLEFDDGTAQTIDFLPVLAGELYGPLRDPLLFAQVTIDPGAHTLLWPNGADFDPATLHDWPHYEPALREMAERWAAVA